MPNTTPVFVEAAGAGPLPSGTRDSDKAASPPTCAGPSAAGCASRPDGVWRNQLVHQTGSDITSMA
jgi:hypothetical protein